jgi:hypothetical protein
MVGREDLGVAAVGVIRWVRAAVVTFASSGLALLGHLTAGGPAPQPGTLVLVVLPVLLVSVGLSGRRWTIGPLLAMLLGAQALFHVAAGAGAAAHVHHGHDVGGALATAGQSGPAMLTAHAAAALLTALLLRRGDDWVWRLAELLARAWRAARIVVDQLAPRPARGIGMSTAAEMPAALHLLEHAVDRRGPPRRAAA